MNYDRLQLARFLRRQAERLEGYAQRIASTEQLEQWRAAARQAREDAEHLDPRRQEYGR